MGIWYGAARSNYVKIADMAGLLSALKPFEIEITAGDNENDGKVCFVGCCNDGDFPGWDYDDDGNEYEFSFEEYVVPFLAEGETLITMQAGTEKQHTVSGYAAAFQKNKPGVYLALSDIYEMAARAFSIGPGCISGAECVSAPH